MANENEADNEEDSGEANGVSRGAGLPYDSLLRARRESRALVGRLFPGALAKDAATMRRALEARLLSSQNVDGSVLRASDLTDRESEVARDFFKAGYFAETAAFLVARRWLPTSEMDRSADSLPATREGIFRKVLGSSSKGAKDGAQGALGVVGTVSASTAIAAGATKAAALAGVSVSGIAVASAINSVALFSSVGLVVMALAFHRVPGFVFSKMEAVRLSPVNSATVLDEAFAVLESSERESERWREVGLTSRGLVDWANSMTSEDKARALSKASLREAFELCLFDGLALSGDAGAAREADRVWSALLARRSGADGFGWAVVDSTATVARAWRRVSGKLDAFSAMVRARSERALDLGRLGRGEDGQGVSPEWLAGRLNEAKAKPAKDGCSKAAP